MGDSLTLSDFAMFELSEVFDMFGKDILDEFKNLREYKERFAAQEWYKAYSESDRFTKALLPKFAKINNV